MLPTVASVVSTEAEAAAAATVPQAPIDVVPVKVVLTRKSAGVLRCQ